ncbi:MAG: hypothetical protein P8M71_03775 [Pseudomonadales bacterium]|nr:hypothetical protein [Pseudomonadales bacterium]
MRALIAILALTMMTSACKDKDIDYWCGSTFIDKCKKGDLIAVKNYEQYAKYCEINSLFYKGIMNDDSVCIYRGEERIFRGRY